MANNPTSGNPNSNSDPFLIQEDAKVYAILVPSRETSPSMLEVVSGLIAYSQYSLQKHQFVKKYQQDEGQPPTEDLIRSMIRYFNDENSAALLSLKEQSKNLLKEYAKEYLENAKREEILEPIEKIVKKHSNFWSSIGANLVAAVLYSFIVAIIIFTATAAAPNTKFAQIIRILLEEQPEPGKPSGIKEPADQ